MLRKKLAFRGLRGLAEIKFEFDPHATFAYANKLTAGLVSTRGRMWVRMRWKLGLPKNVCK